jgi:hypothetical protein
MTAKQCAVKDIGQDAEMCPVLILIEDDIREYLSDDDEPIIPIEV